MREIELKFRAPNLNKVISFLETCHCKISMPISQNDTIYVEDLDHTASLADSIFLRIRKTDTAVELNYKRQSSEQHESEEIEFEVSSYEKAESFLQALGFKKWVEVNKKRRHAKYQNYNICIDEVERLGAFVEIELLINSQDEIDYEKQLLSVAKEIGLNPNNRVKSHYDTMIAEL